MNKSNETPGNNSQETVGDKTTEENEAQETQQYDKDSDPKYQEVLHNFFRKNVDEEEPLFDEIQKVIAGGNTKEISIFYQSYTEQLSEEAKIYLGTEHTLKLMEQRREDRDNFNSEQQTENIKKVSTYESLRASFESDPVYQSVVQIFWSKLEEKLDKEGSGENEESINEKVMTFTSVDKNSTEIQDFIDQNLGLLSSEARNYLEGKKYKAKMLEKRV